MLFPPDISIFHCFALRLRTTGGSMATKRVKLTFPQELIKEPVIFTMARKFNVMPNIRRAKVTDNVGEVVLELEGEEKELAASIAYLKERGVKVDAVEGDAAGF
jgi:ABC-type methionine transport system ATPase subunit